MWQRIQTLYLGIALALTLVMLFSSCAFVLDPSGEKVGINYAENTAYLLFLISAATAGVFAIGTYKYRFIQMRVAVIYAIMMLGFQIWLAVDFFRAPEGVIFSLTAVFPIAICILAALAARGIFMDEAMVQSAARIRSAKKRHHR